MPGKPPSERPLSLDFLSDADAFIRRLILAEVMGPPRARKRPAAPRPPPQGSR